MAGLQQLLLVLVGVCVAGVTACPSQCTCSTYRGNPADIHVDCSGKGLQRIPEHDIPTNTRSLNLANNELTEIDERLSSLNLVALNLSGNHIRDLDYNGGRGISNFKGDCDLEEFVFNRIKHVNAGYWQILDLTETPWPCSIDLRNNPISKIKSLSFDGSHNFTLFLGESASDLTIESAAFANTSNIIGLHISNVRSLNFGAGSLFRMRNMGWLVIDKTRLAITDGFSLADQLQLHWLRISNCDVTALEYLQPQMDVQTTCYMKTYPYGYNKQLTESTSTIYKGGIEFINNTLPVLWTQLFGDSNLGGVYFKSNKIAGFESKVFAQRRRSTDLCIIRFEDNDVQTLTPRSFGGLENVVHISISGGNLASIGENAFADSSNIGSLSISVTGNPDYERIVIQSKAFAKVTGVKVFSVSGIDGWGKEEGVKPRLLLQPHAFDGLKDVEYMAVNLYENMRTLPNDLFTGLTVNQDFNLRVKNLMRISHTAFGGTNPGTRINRLQVWYMQKFPCDCETAKLNDNMKVNVGKVVGLTCTGPYHDGTISHSWRLDHATCSASCLQFNLALVTLISLFLTF